MASVPNAVVPGQRLGHVQEYNAGAGTYSHQDFLYASVVGIKKILEAQGEVLSTTWLQTAWLHSPATALAGDWPQEY